MIEDPPKDATGNECTTINKVYEVNKDMCGVTLDSGMVRAILDGRKSQIRIPVQEDKWIWDRLWVAEDLTIRKAGVRYQALYKADNHIVYFEEDMDIGHFKAEEMPMEMARIVLEVKRVFQSSLQDIKGAEAFKEGVEPLCPHSSECASKGGYFLTNFRDQNIPRECCCCRGVFKTKWNNIHGDTQFEWKNNPKVWVVEFESNATVSSQMRGV